MPSSESIWQISRLVRKGTESKNRIDGNLETQYYGFSPIIKADERISLPGYVLEMNRSVYSGDFSFSVSTEDNVEIFFVHGGEMTVSCKKDEGFFCRASELLIVRPERELTLKQVTEASLDLLRIKCSGTLSRQLSELICENDFEIISMSPKEASKIMEICESLLPLLTVQSRVGNVCISNLLSELLTDLYKIKALSISDGRQYRERPAWLLATNDYIDQNLNKKLTVSELSARCQMSESSFFKRFREEIGMSPYDYLLKRRLERAATLLRTTGFQIKTVSRLVGFPSSNHFSARFRERYGVLPHEYRK